MGVKKRGNASIEKTKQTKPSAVAAAAVAERAQCMRHYIFSLNWYLYILVCIK